MCPSQRNHGAPPDVSCMCLQVEGVGSAASAHGGREAEPPAASPAADPPVGQPWLWESASDWLRKHKDGKWGKYAEKFEGVSGEELCELTEEQIKSEVSGLYGCTLFNDIAKLKKPATSSSSESSPKSAAGTVSASPMVPRTPQLAT